MSQHNRVMVLAVAAAAMTTLFWEASANGAEIKVLGPLPMKAAMSALIPGFERSTGTKVTIEYGAGSDSLNRVQNGPPDVAILSAPQIEAAMKQGKIVADSRKNLAKMGVGVIVPHGDPQPDISTVEAFKSSVLAAKSLVQTDPAGGAPAGTYVAGLFERMGIASQIKAKTKFVAPGGFVLEAIAKHEAELGFDNIPSIAAASGIDLVGPLPEAIQNTTVQVGGILVTSNQKEDAKLFIDFFASAEAKAILKAKGFDPG